MIVGAATHRPRAARFTACVRACRIPGIPGARGPEYSKGGRLDYSCQLEVRDCRRPDTRWRDPSSAPRASARHLSAALTRTPAEVAWAGDDPPRVGLRGGHNGDPRSRSALHSPGGRPTLPFPPARASMAARHTIRAGEPTHDTIPPTAVVGSPLQLTNGVA